MFIDQNPLIIKISEIEQFIIPKEIGFCPIHIIRKRLPDSFSCPVDHSTKLFSKDPVMPRIHTAPDIKKCVFILHDQNVLRGLFGPGIIRERLRSLIKCQLFPTDPNFPAKFETALSLEKLFPTEDLEAPLIHRLLGIKQFGMIFQIITQNLKFLLVRLIAFRMVPVIGSIDQRMILILQFLIDIRIIRFVFIFPEAERKRRSPAVALRIFHRNKLVSPDQLHHICIEFLIVFRLRILIEQVLQVYFVFLHSEIPLHFSFHIF